MADPDTTYTLTVGLRMFAVELSGRDVDPQFVNPATLQLNGVADEEWTHSGTQIGMTESHIRYANGLHIEAFEQTVRFEHVLTGGEFLSAETARRYVSAFGDNSWGGVVLEFGGTLELTTEPDSAAVSLRPHRVDILTHNGIVPAFRAGALYPNPEHFLQVEILQSAPNSDQFECTAAVIRRLPRNEEAQTENRLQTILSSWESDWQDAVSALTCLIRAALNPGGN